MVAVVAETNKVNNCVDIDDNEDINNGYEENEIMNVNL